MAMVIVGLMKDPHDARAAVRALREAGFVLEEIEPHEEMAECLSDFGVPEGELAVYAEGVRRGGTVVGVAAHTETEAENAAYIMAEHGALDVAACAQSWTAESAERLFGEIPSAPGRVYRDTRTRRPPEDMRYNGPERRRYPRDSGAVNRRGA